MATNNSLSKTIESLEDQTWRALQHSGEDFLPYLSPDCIMLFALGMKISHSTSPDLRTVMTSEAFVPWLEYEMKEVDVTPVGANGAIISYSATATRPGMKEPFKAMMSTTWRQDQESGKWMVCFHQQTPFIPIEESILDEQEPERRGR